MTRHLFNARHGEYLPVPHDLFVTVYEAEWNEEATPADHADAIRFFCREKGVDLEQAEVAIREADDDVEWAFWIAVDDEHRTAALLSLLGELDTLPGGDDDTFDYWPSGVWLARALATTNSETEQVEHIVARVLDLKGYDADEVGV
jgi:hypothetical protein